MRTIYRATGGQGGVPLDDTWIHLQFARNLASGYGLAYNAGQPTAGTTAPLWTVILAGLAWVRAPFPIAAQLLSAFCFLAVLVVTFRLGVRETANPFLAWLGAASTALNGRLAWAGVSGLETCLFTALSWIAIGCALHDRSERRMHPLTGVLFGLAALSRPEGYLLFGLALTDFIATAVTGGGPGRGFRWTRLPVGPLLLFAVLVTPYLAFTWRTSGRLLPNTFHAKAMVSPRPDVNVLSLAAQYLILDTTVVLPLCLLGAVLLLRTQPLTTLWSMALPLAYAFMHVPLYQHGRYLMPLIPFQGLCLAAGVQGLPAVLRHWRAARPLHRAAWPVILALLALLATGWRLPTMARLTAANVDNINHMHVALGKWAAQHTPPDALLAVNDIGAIAYFSQRPVLDLAGLVSPEVIPLLVQPGRDERLTQLITERQVQYAIIFPNWFPGLASRRDLLQPVYEVTLTDNTIAGGDTMVVYRVSPSQ